TEGADAEDIRAGPVERVPPADGAPEVILHPLAEDEPVGLVDLEGQGIGRVEAGVWDPPGHLGEERVAHGRILRSPATPRPPVLQPFCMSLSQTPAAVGPGARIPWSTAVGSPDRDLDSLSCEA